MVIAGVVIVGAFVAWKYYQKRQAAAPTTVTTVNNAAPADSTSQQIKAGSDAINSIVNFFQ